MLNKRSLLSQFVHFSAATVASLMVFSLYSIVDGLFVAKGVGEYAMSAVNLAVPFTNVMFSIAVLFAVGTSTIIAIYLGQGSRENANSLFSQNLAVLVVIGLVITALVLIFLEPFAMLLGAKDVTLEYTKDYLRGLAPFAVCFIVSYNMEILVKTDGRPTLAIVTVITGCLTNCVLDYVAIFLLDWGAWGAAFATGLSQLLTCVIYLTHFLGKRTTFHLVRFRPDWHIYRRLLPIGVSDGVTELCNGVMIFLFNRTILRCIGQDGLVSYTIIAYINTLILNIMLGGVPGVPAPGQLSLRPEGPGRLPPSAALWSGNSGGYDRSVLRRGAAAGAPDRPRLLRGRKPGAEPLLGGRPAAVRPVLSDGGLQRADGRLPDGGGAAPPGHLHLRGPGAGAAGRSPAAAGGGMGRQCHLVRAGDLRGPVPGDGPGLYDPVLAKDSGPGPDQLIRIPNKYPAGNRLLHRMPAVFFIFSGAPKSPAARRPGFWAGPAPAGSGCPGTAG